MKAIILLSVLFFSSRSWAFVENTAKGYPNCMACHVSPTGGGLLNSYGRSLSREFMSTFKAPKGFEKPYYGLLQNSEHVTYGGQFRSIQVYGENNQVKLKKSFIMQNNLEFGVKYMNAMLVGTVGTQEGPKTIKRKSEFLSERHFALWDLTPVSKVRVGKFRQHFGINHPNHTRFTKSNFNFGSNSETYNLEISNFYDWGEINLSTSIGKIFGREKDDNGRRNLIFNFTHYLEGKSRLGFSLMKDNGVSYESNIAGVNAFLPMGKILSFRGEIDYADKDSFTNQTVSRNQKQLVSELQLNAHLFAGLMPYLFFEHQQTDLSSNQTLISAPGIGLQFLPVPHVELQAEYQQRHAKSTPGNTDHRSFITFHLYH
jgi:hypothetical protein